MTKAAKPVPKIHPRPKAVMAELPPQADTPPVPVTGADFPPSRVTGVGTLGAHQNVPYYVSEDGRKIVADGHPLAGEVIR
jgi:hypothetical protein